MLHLECLYLVDPEVRIWRDDRPGGEVDSLPHEVAPDPSLLPIEPGLDGLERPPALLHGLGQTRHVVVDERGHVELEHLDVLRDDVGCRARLLVPRQLVVGLDDVGKLVREIVLERSLEQKCVVYCVKKVLLMKKRSNKWFSSCYSRSRVQICGEHELFHNAKIRQIKSDLCLL